MERVKIFNLITLVLTFLALVPNMESQVKTPVIPIPPTTPRPLCASQFALVNYACSRLPFIPGIPPTPLPPLNSPPSPDDDDDDNDDGGGGDGDDEGHRNNHHRHGNSHSHSHNHRHSHKHGHRHRHSQNPEEENCCRWAKEVDNQCVCELLLRLPPFLVRPLHRYTLNVGDLCEITYSCGAPI